MRFASRAARTSSTVASSRWNAGRVESRCACGIAFGGPSTSKAAAARLTVLQLTTHAHLPALVLQRRSFLVDDDRAVFHDPADACKQSGDVRGRVAVNGDNVSDE